MVSYSGSVTIGTDYGTKHKKIAVLEEIQDPVCQVRRKVETSVTRRPGYKTIDFNCVSIVEEVFHGYQDIYNAIIDGTIYGQFCVLPGCRPGEDTPRCAFRRGHLSECSCRPLSRKDHPGKRELYENQVIDKILEIFDKTIETCKIGRDPNPPLNVNVTVFASGELHGEVVLIIRLIDRLRQKRFEDDRNFKINISLIDLLYQTCISNAWNQSFDNEYSLGGNLTIKQFLTEITYALPNWISIEGTFFGDANEYLSAVETNREKYGHNLLIGCDIRDARNDTLPFFQEIQSKASLHDEPGIVMIHDYSTEALMCDVTIKTICKSIEAEVGPPPVEVSPIHTCPALSPLPHQSGVRPHVGSSRRGSSCPTTSSQDQGWCSIS